MKLTNEQLKQIIKEELEAVMDEGRNTSSDPMPNAKGPYDTENFRRLQAYGKPGLKAQQIIRDTVAAGNYPKLNHYANYSASMNLTKGNDFGFGLPQNPDPEKLKRIQSHFHSAFRDAHMNRPDKAPEEAPEEKPGVMDRIKGFFKEE